MPTLEYSMREKAIVQFVTSIQGNEMLADISKEELIKFVRIYHNLSRRNNFSDTLAVESINFLQDMLFFVPDNTPNDERSLIPHPVFNAGNNVEVNNNQAPNAEQKISPVTNNETRLIIHPDHIPNSERRLIRHPVFNNAASNANAEIKQEPSPEGQTQFCCIC